MKKRQKINQAYFQHELKKYCQQQHPLTLFDEEFIIKRSQGALLTYCQALVDGSTFDTALEKA